ncbi:MAG TPA: ribonuclease J [Thermoanaerobaculaceae bacterium]|nr:ribonuclease J [Thermoanaerobaculaceae bacterium]HRS15105.1 ribonuclease J [Thermoanaerobaculaceae bacterium]
MPRLLPIGGLGEFGANSLLLDDERAGRLVVDAGAAFFEEPALGVSHEVPDFAALGGPAPRAALLSHAHDDHCKGLGALLGAWPGTLVAGSRATATWCRPAVAAQRGQLAELGEGAPFVVGGWEIDALPVSHSIPGTLALRLRTGAMTAVLATDLRMAPSALGERTPTDRLAAWGRDGVDVLLLDATNALVAAAPPGEDVVGTALGELIRAARGLVVVVTFASHLGRFRQVLQAAAAAGRVVVPVGRGILESLAVQARLGGFGAPLGLVRPFRDLPRLPRDGVVAVVTGSQGEAGSVFTRLATGHLPGLALQPGDRVLHAARLIPGNERRLARLFDFCVRQGAQVVTAAEAPIHASGHAHRQELAELCDLLRPRVVMPVHGWRRHLEAVAGLARAAGAAAVVAENGEELAWSASGLEPSGRRRAPGRLSFGDGEDELVEAGVVHERRVLARSGVLVAVVDRCAGAAPRVQLHSFGVRLAAGGEEELEAGLRGEAVRCLAAPDPDDARRTMERWLKRELRRRWSMRPAVLVSVLQDGPWPAAGGCVS